MVLTSDNIVAALSLWNFYAIVLEEMWIMLGCILQKDSLLTCKTTKNCRSNSLTQKVLHSETELRQTRHGLILGKPLMRIFSLLI